MNKHTKYFYTFITLIFILILSLEIINNRFAMVDFRVYYGAAKAYLNAEQVYQRVFGEDTGLFKYSPVVLWLFAPATVLPYFLACLLHYVCIAFAFVFSLRLAFRLGAEYLNLNNTYKIAVLVASTVFTLNHLFRELHLGNVNVILVFTILLAFHLQERGRTISSGFLFAVIVLAKPYLLLPAIPFLLAKNWPLIKAGIISTLLIFFLFVLSNGFTYSLHLHQEWIQGMLNHSEFLTSTNTFQSMLRIWFSIELSGAEAAALLLIIVLGLFFALRSKLFAKLGRAEQYVLFTVLLALIPCLVITDTEHFLFALPLILLLLLQVFEKKNVVLAVVTLLALLAYGANLGDLIGDSISVTLEHSGVLGAGNLLLIVICVILSSRSNKLNSGIDNHV